MKLSTKRLLLYSNILTASLFFFLSIREKYPRRIYRRIFKTQPEPYSYTKNLQYTEYTALYPLYQRQKDIVMLGTSLTSHANNRGVANAYAIWQREVEKVLKQKKI